MSRIPEISQHTFWISGSGNILSANNFQRMNKGVEREKTERFFYFHRFSDVPYTNGCFPIMAAITLKIPVLKVIPEPHSWPVPFYCRLLDTCLLIHLDIRSLARLFLLSTVPERLIVAGVFLILVNFLYVGYMTTATLWALCVSLKLASIHFGFPEYSKCELFPKIE